MNDGNNGNGHNGAEDLKEYCNVGYKVAESLLEMARKLPELLDQLDSGKIDVKDFSKTARSLIKVPSSLDVDGEKSDVRMWAFFKGIMDEWLDAVYETTTQYMGGLKEATKQQFTDALDIFHNGKKSGTEMKIDQILEILTKKQENS